MAVVEHGLHTYLPLEPALDDCNLAREDHHPAKLGSALLPTVYRVRINALAELGLDVEPTVHGHDEEIAVRVDERLLGHVGVARVEVDGEPLARHRPTVAQHRPEAVNECDLLICGGRMWRPCVLGGRDVLFRVTEGEVCYKLQAGRVRSVTR